MSFKENLLKKVHIDRTAQKVLRTIGPVGSDRKIDRETMRSLLETAAYEYRHVRDLDLFIQTKGSGKGRILVLDNDLTIYNTTVEDVAMRKSPTVKEMISIKNAIRILSDKDVVVSKKEKSLETVHGLCLAGLNLSFDETDINSLAAEGIASLDDGDTQGVIECMDLFSELLGYRAPPNPLKFKNCQIWGVLHRTGAGDLKFGPMVVYDRARNRLTLIKQRFSVRDEKDLTRIKDAVVSESSGTGESVFEYLATIVLKSGRHSQGTASALLSGT